MLAQSLDIKLCVRGATETRARHTNAARVHVDSPRRRGQVRTWIAHVQNVQNAKDDNEFAITAGCGTYKTRDV